MEMDIETLFINIKKKKKMYNIILLKILTMYEFEMLTISTANKPNKSI